jgi:predicted nucleic acid-binding protein
VADLLIDTDVFVDHLRGSRLLRTGRNRAHFSVITRCELLAGTSASELVGRLLQPFRELVVDRVVAERAGRIRRETGVRTPDALIAATALEHGLTLVTRNRRHFEAVRGLRIRGPL